MVFEQDIEASEAILRPVSPLSVEERVPPQDTNNTLRVVNVPIEKATYTDILLPNDSTGTWPHGDVGDSPPKRRTSKGVLRDIAIVTIITMGAMCVAFWLILHVEFNTRRGFIEAERIGGQFSSTWAKLIDAACSIILAPSLLALGNWYAFIPVRLCAVDQTSKGHRPVSLKALAELAGTDWGSYGLLKYWAFFQSRDSRFICRSAVALSSALSFSFLTNVVAYEAGEFGTGNSTLAVEALYAPSRNGTDNEEYPFLGRQQTVPVLIKENDFELSVQLFDQLQRLRSQVTLFDGEGEARANVSSRSRSRIPKSARRLFGVPAYRLAASCRPSVVENVRFEFDPSKNRALQFGLLVASPGKDSEPSRFWGRIENLGPLIAGKYTSGLPRPLLAFGDNETEYGDLKTYMYTGVGDIPGVCDSGRVSNRTFCGVACTLERTTGWATVNRTCWSIQQLTLDNSTQEVENRRPMLNDLQYEPVFGLSGAHQTPGIGHLAKMVFDSSMDMMEIQRVVNAFVWLEVDARHVAYDMAQVEREAGL
ncbi:hypothetical protein ACJZ2D_006582 [Fusarium nematophilum]